MAAAFGARILKEIKEESLDQLLSSLLAALPIEHNPCIPTIPFLQDLLSSRPQETATATTIREPVQSPSLAIPSSPSPPDSPGLEGSIVSKLTYAAPPVIEIQPSAPAGRTTQLLSYLVSCLLQDSPAPSQRPKQTVLYFDSAWKVSVQQIHKLLLDQSDRDDKAATDALSRLHIVRPDSSQQILAQLKHIEEYLSSLLDQDCMLSAIVLADLGVWYWHERLAEEIQSQTASGSGNRAYGRETLHAMIVEAVHSLQSRFKCMVIVSNLGVIGKSNNSGPPIVRSGLAGSWTRRVDIRLLLGRNVNGTTCVDVDATKWIQKCGGSSQAGKGTFEMHTNNEAVSVTQFKHNS